MRDEVVSEREESKVKRRCSFQQFKIGKWLEEHWRIVEILKVVFLLLCAYFLGYVAAYLTNQQIEEYCFNYRNIQSYNHMISNINIVSNFTWK